MRMLRFLFLLWVAFYPIVHGSPQYWKHHSLQKNVGSCHTFATIALIEAEYYKQKGRHIDLSERDLFIRHYMGKHTHFNSFMQSQVETALQQNPSRQQGESGSVARNFKMAQRYGICAEKELPYRKRKTGVPSNMKALRKIRQSLAKKAQKLRHSGKSQPRSQNTIIHKYTKRLHSSRLKQFFTHPKPTQTSKHIKQWLAPYTLKVITPKTTKEAKQHLIQKLRNQPVAVDITNFHELIKKSFTRNLTHTKHSLTVFKYDSSSDTFSIRSSTHKKTLKVSANALSRGCYRLYYLEK